MTSTSFPSAIILSYFFLFLYDLQWKFAVLASPHLAQHFPHGNCRSGAVRVSSLSKSPRLSVSRTAASSRTKSLRRACSNVAITRTSSAYRRHGVRDVSSHLRFDVATVFLVVVGHPQRDLRLHTRLQRRRAALMFVPTPPPSQSTPPFPPSLFSLFFPM